MAIVNFEAYKDRTSKQHLAYTDPLIRRGYRFLSIAIYGDPVNPLYAGVLVLRDTSTAQKAKIDMGLAEIKSVSQEMSNEGLAPVVISVTGPASNPRFAAIFEPARGASPSALFDMDQMQFDELNAVAHGNGLIPRSAAIYGNSTADRRYAAVWWPNSDQALWQVFSDDNLADTQQKFDAMLSQWGRPVFIARSADGRYVCMYRSDNIGPFIARTGLTTAQYQDQYEKARKPGLFPVYVEAVGTSASETRFTAIFAGQEDVLQRKFTMTGVSKPNCKPLDDLMELVMKKAGGRAASLAVMHKGELIHSRGYTWAESNYPQTQPDSLFRIASCSKALTAIVAHQLFDQGLLSAEDFIQPLLQLTPPPRMNFSGYAPRTRKSWVDEIQVKHLVAHTSGLNHDGRAIATVAAAYQHPANIVVPKREYISDALCNMGFSPGSANAYSNAGYVLLGMVIAAKTGLTYEKAVQEFLFKPLNITTAQVGRMLAKDRAPNEVIYQTKDFNVGKSQVTNDQPFVGTQYGSGGDMHELLDAAGGWIISTVDYARVLSALDHSPAVPVFKQPTTSDDLWKCGVWEPALPTENAKDATDKPSVTHAKTGGFGGTAAVILRRDDQFSAAAFIAFDDWASTPDMSLAGVSGTWASYQINERLNLIKN